MTPKSLEFEGESDYSGSPLLSDDKESDENHILQINVDVSENVSEAYACLSEAMVRFQAEGNGLVLITALLHICEKVVSNLVETSVLLHNAVQLVASILNPSVVNYRCRKTSVCLLHYVCRLNDIDAVRILLSNPHVDVDVRDGCLCTALTVVAMSNQNVDIARELLKRGAQANQRNNLDLSPIHYAAKAVNIPLLNLLYHSIDTRLMSGRTYLAERVSETNEEPWTKFVLPLVPDKTNVVDVYECGRFIASKFLYGGVEQSDILSLSTGPISIAPAQWTAWKDVLDSSRFISVSVVQSACDYSEVELSAVGQMDLRFDMINSLLSNGRFSINDIDEKTHDTVQLLFCRQGLKKLIQLTIDLGADPEYANLAGETALKLSLGKVWWAEISKSSYEKLWNAIKKNDLEEIRRLVEAGVDLNVPNAQGEYALGVAVQFASVETVALLISKASDVNMKPPHGETPLLLAASRGFAGAVAVLIDAGATLNCKVQSNNCLHLMAMEGYIEALKICIYKALGTYPGLVKDLVIAKNIEGLTPVMCAAKFVKKECVDFLSSAGSKADEGYLEKEAELVRIAVDQARKAAAEEKLKAAAAAPKSDSSANSPESDTSSSTSDSKKSEVEVVAPPDEVLIQKMLKRTDIELLYHACKFGLTEIVKQQLPFIGPSINHKVEEQNYVMVKDKLTEVIRTETALYVSCYYGHKEIVEELLNCGADPNLPARNGWSSLFVASKKGYLDIVKMLVARGANVHFMTSNDMTPLNIAAYGGYVEIVQELLDRSADVNKGDKMGARPMHAAIQSGKYDVVKLLLDHGADINGVTNTNITPLYVAAYSGNEPMVDLFLGYEPPARFANVLSRVEVNFMNKEGLTPITVAAFNGHTGIVEKLLNKGADLTITEKKKATALYVACQNGHINVVRLLLNRHADPNAPIGNGNTPVHAVAIENKHEILKILIDHDAELDVINVDGVTPLYMACEKGHIEILKMLIAGGANVNTPNKHTVSPLNIASQNGHNEVVRMLIDNGANVNSQTEDGPTPLFIASQNGHLEICKMLLQANAVVDTRTKEKETALFVAGYFGYTEIVAELIKFKAHVNLVDRDTRTPLWWACKAGKERVVKLLMDAGADVNISDREHVTPMMIAIQHERNGVCELLNASKS